MSDTTPQLLSDERLDGIFYDLGLVALTQSDIQDLASHIDALTAERDALQAQLDQRHWDAISRDLTIEKLRAGDGGCWR